MNDLEKLIEQSKLKLSNMIKEKENLTCELHNLAQTNKYVSKQSIFHYIEILMLGYHY
ncbi:hypothetical protein RNJ44_04048 [Nakaseomyces bracarensis]|uniref:Uncharacterized protein n=1 Tax=Nakaseomyces bracarensis TaxID=273131 RepID=A0ABR4NTT3_9SACH